MGRAQGKVALVTGAARGIGRACSLRLAAEGADIIALDLCDQIDSVDFVMPTLEDLDETVQQVEALGQRISASQADVRDLESVKKGLDRGVATLGRLDIVCANAGLADDAPIEEVTENQWQDLFDVNVTGVWNTIRAAVPYLKANPGGSIVITSSLLGLKGAANMAPYSASKHAVVGLMRSLALELAPSDIRVNTVHPTNVNTKMIMHEAMYKLFRPDLEHPTREDFAASAMNMHALAIPWVEAVDISNALLFLASDEARYVTGVAMPVDGGALLI